MKKIFSILIVLVSLTSLKAQEVEPQSDFKNLIVEFGKTYLGTAYAYGGCTSKGFDCSGFVSYVFKMGGVLLPRSSRDMAREGSAVNVSNLKKGDLLFFKTSKSNSISHVGIVSEVKDGSIIMLHSSTSYGVQEVDILKSNYWRSRLVSTKSIF